MPNWCNNSITIRHSDPAMIQRVMNSKGLLMEFFPTPQDLLDTVAGSVPEGAERDAHQAQMKSNLEKYGYKDWYDWNVANWGTKWDVTLEDAELEGSNSVSAWFDSAWAPPVNAYERLIEQGFYIKAYYNEPGMGFCGVWEGDAEHGFDDDYREYSGETSETVRDAIGEELDDFFGISENMREWEEENAEENEE